MNQKATIPARLRWPGSVEFWVSSLWLGLAIGLIADWQWVRGPEEWRWKSHLPPGIQERLWVAALLLIVVGVLGYWLITRPESKSSSRRRKIAIPMFLFVSALLAQLTILYLEHPQPIVTLFRRTVSPISGGYFNAASSITDVQDLLGRFPELMPGFTGIHPRTHPPGLLLLFWGTSQLLAHCSKLADALGMAWRIYVCHDLALMSLSNVSLASAIVQMALPLASALTVLPFYNLARQWFDARTAGCGALLLGLAPSMVLWTPGWNQVYALAAISGLYILHLGLKSRRWRPFLLAGVIVSVGAFLDLSNLAIGFSMLAYAVVFWAVSFHQSAGRPFLWSGSWRIVAKQLFAFAVGAASIWVVYFLVYRVSFLEILRAAMAAHAELNRSYWLWLGYNLYDFLLFLGFPVVLALALTLKDALSSRPRRKLVQLSSAPMLAFWLTWIILDVSGTVRGETARLWIFLTPIALLASLRAVASWTPRRAAVMLSVQIAQLILLGYFLRPMSTGYPFYAPRQARTSAPPISHPIEAQLGSDNAVTLLGYDVAEANPQAGDTLRLILYWRAERRLPYAYQVFVHLVDGAGQLRGQHDGMPQGGELPTTCWPGGEVVSDEHPLPLDAALPAGEYAIHVGLYRLDLYSRGDPNHRLPVHRDGETSDYVDLGAIWIAAPDDGQ